MDLSVINPRREKSGVYKVIFRNAQGQDERDINVNIMGNYKHLTFSSISSSLFILLSVNFGSIRAVGDFFIMIYEVS